MELVERARAGDNDAFNQLIIEHKEAVFRLAYLMLRNAEDAEDVTQEAFLRAYRHIGKFDADRAFRPWILSIAANLCRNQKRGLGRYWHAVWRFAGEQISENGSVEGDVIQQQDVQRLLDAIGELKHHEQEIIYLRYFLDLDVKTTSEVLNVQPGTVKSRLHRALKQLEWEMIQDE
jgi:RNA polymerase sigma factor (sigma-70 family)